MLSPATIFARGAGVDVSVQVACEPPFLPSAEAFVEASLSEILGRKINNGVSAISDLITCDGGFHTFEVVVIGSTRWIPGRPSRTVSKTSATRTFCASKHHNRNRSNLLFTKGNREEG